jgi:hypothetical protein
MPQMLHDAVQKALVTKEYMNSGGQGKTPYRKTWHSPPRALQHQTLDRHTYGHRDMPRGPAFLTPWRQTPYYKTPYRGPQQQQQCHLQQKQQFRSCL